VIRPLLLAAVLLCLTATVAHAEIETNDGVYTGSLGFDVESVVVDASLASVQCDGGAGTLSVDGENDSGSVTALTVVDCSPACTATAAGLPVDFTVDATDGTVVLTDALTLAVTCALITCTFTGAANAIMGAWDNAAEQIFLGGALTASTALCGTATVAVAARIRFTRSGDMTTAFGTTSWLDGGTFAIWIEP
jgi:hypothetical protein